MLNKNLIAFRHRQVQSNTSDTLIEIIQSQIALLILIKVVEHILGYHPFSHPFHTITVFCCSGVSPSFSLSKIQTLREFSILCNKRTNSSFNAVIV